MEKRTEFMEARAEAARQLQRKAGELKALAQSSLESSGNLNRLSSGFQELATLAETCERKKFHRNSRQLSVVFARTIRSIPEDVPFILKVAVDFLGKVENTPNHDLEQVAT